MPSTRRYAVSFLKWDTKNLKKILNIKKICAIIMSGSKFLPI